MRAAFSDLRALNNEIHALMRRASKLGQHETARHLIAAASTSDRAVDSFQHEEPTT